MFIPKESLTKENIFKKISSYDIFKTYSDNFVELGKSFPSDLRPNDKNPSAQIAIIHGEPLYTDFGLGKSFRAIDFLMYLRNLSYPEALQQINIDFKLNLGGTIITSSNQSSSIPIIGKTPIFKEKTPTILKKRQRPFSKKDLEYWNDFYWTEWMLTTAKTQAISHYWINDNMWVVKPDELAFSYEYYWHDNRMQRKLYFPERKEFKWISNVDNTIVQLSDVAPKTGDVLFITSSKKDGGIFWRMQLENMFPGKVIHGVAPNNEGSFVPEKWFKKMQSRWSRIIGWYNNDEAGIKNSIKFAEKFNIEFYWNLEGTPKDPSDFSKKNTLNEFKHLIESKL